MYATSFLVFWVVFCVSYHSASMGGAYKRFVIVNIAHSCIANFRLCGGFLKKIKKIRIRWHLKLYFSYLKSGAYSCLARRKTMFTFGKGKINISNPFKIKKNTYLYCKTWECILYQTICFQIRVWNAFFIWNTIFVLKFDERFSLFARPSWPISVFD